MNGFLQVTNIDGSPIPIAKVVYSSNGETVYDNGMCICMPQHFINNDGVGSGISHWGSWSPLLGTSTTEPNKGDWMYWEESNSGA